LLRYIHVKLRSILPFAVLMTWLSSAAFAAENITIVGTGDGIAISQSLGKAYSKIHPGTTVTVPPSIGSSGGIKAVGNDKYRLGRVARQIKEKEKPYGLTYLPFARVAATFFVNNSIKVRNLSKEQILGIYSGEIKNWKDVGGNDGKIRVVRREEGDSTLRVLRKTFPGFSDIELLKKSKTTTTTEQTMKVVSTTVGAIGFGPYPAAKRAKLGIISINGKHPTDPSNLSHTVLALIFKEKNRTGEIAEFVEFATSPAASEAIREAYGQPY